ncbi:class I SAM-dependent methyltransferase [Alphaproteobacteria bacterium]|nr:class I SAM-dependent methyltransferase [Alphaproteobacteria bacterium]
MNLIKCENVLGVSNRDNKKNLYNLKELIDQSVIVDHVDKEPIYFNEEGDLLPFANNSFYNVLFNASLDHILDYHKAISEAFRVLKKNGYIYISSYVWKEKATLLKDIIHFHHFRDEQLLSSVENYFNISEVLRYECPKNNNHRY